MVTDGAVRAEHSAVSHPLHTDLLGVSAVCHLLSKGTSQMRDEHSADLGYSFKVGV